MQVMPTTQHEDDLELQDIPAVEEPFQAPILTELEQTVTGAHGVSGTSGHVLFLYNLVWQMKAQLVVEIGLGPGDSTSVFLLALKHTGGRLLSIDIHAQTIAENKVDALGLRDRWTFIQQESQAVAREWSDCQLIDILLIDGKHSYNQVKLEYELYRPLMRRGGFILFHDSETIRGVRKFTAELRQNSGGVQLPYANGLFVTRVE